MTSQRAASRSVWLTTYAIAMGILESAVVVYLRELYYPSGFRFPLVELPQRLALIEICREVCTLVMLFTVAAIAARDRLDGFFVFGFLFGVWDLVYYAGLKLFVGWPASPWTWDVLFLIPLPWVAPVLAPILVSLLLVAGYAAHAFARSRQRCIRPHPTEWAVAGAGGIVVVGTLCWQSGSAATQTQMVGFPWMVFVLGVLVGIAPFLRAATRALRA